MFWRKRYSTPEDDRLSDAKRITRLERNKNADDMVRQGRGARDANSYGYLYDSWGGFDYNNVEFRGIVSGDEVRVSFATVKAIAAIIEKKEKEEEEK